MKCDELVPERYFHGEAGFPFDKVDEAIAELKYCKDEWGKQCTMLTAENAELKQKLHDAEMRADLAEAAETERKIDYDNLKKDLAYIARQIYLKHNRQTLRAWLSGSRTTTSTAARTGARLPMLTSSRRG